MKHFLFLHHNQSKAAELNYPAALNKLGNFFYSGYGVEKIDMAKAIDFYEKAASLNDPDALINLGLIFIVFKSYIFYFRVLLEAGNELIHKDIQKVNNVF